MGRKTAPLLREIVLKPVPPGKMPRGAAVAVPLLPEVICKVPPLTVTPPVKVLTALPTTKVPAVTLSPPVVVPMTPFKFSVPGPDLAMPKVAPLMAELMVAVPVILNGVAARVSPKAVPPEIVGMPSSTVRPPMVGVPLRVTVKPPVASAPAEKTATLPLTQAAGVVVVPSAVAFQKVLVPQVPAGAVPAPATVPLESQYTVAAWRVWLATKTIAEMVTARSRGLRVGFIFGFSLGVCG